MRALTLEKLSNVEWIFCKESFSVMNRELIQVLKTRQGIDRVESFLACLWEHLGAAAATYFDCEREALPYGALDIADAYKKEVLSYYIMGFVDDMHREHIVRCHAQNMPTTHAVYDLIDSFPDICRLSRDDALGEDRLVSLLVHRLSYLKPSSNRWPGAKYSDVWFEARKAYRETQRTLDLPYTSLEERLMVLSREVDRIVDMLETGGYTAKEYQTLLDTLHQLFDRLEATDTRSTPSIQLSSAPQLIGILERLTVALTSTEAVSGSVDIGEVVRELKALAPASTEEE